MLIRPTATFLFLRENLQRMRMIKIDDGIDVKSNGIRCEITRQVTESEYVLKVRSMQPRDTPRFSLWSFKQIPISFVFM